MGNTAAVSQPVQPGDRVPVVIVGGGPVGLASSLELARHGVPSLVLERHPSTTWHPKARNLNTRTMEVARGWGQELHDGLAALNLPTAWRSQIIYTRSLVGEELGRMETVGFRGPGPDVSPEVPLLSSQDVFEPLMRQAAEKTGLGELRFGHEVVELQHGGAPGDDHALVTVEERSTGRRYQVEAAYLLAADGANSGIRRQLGISLSGPQDLAHFVNVYFRADFSRWTNHRPALLYWVADGDTRGVFQPLDAQFRWLCQIAYDGTPEGLAGHTHSRCLEWIRAAVGTQDAEAEVLSVESWGLSVVVAERLVSGRVILVGDAAHRIPPIGGFGLNTGIQGAHNLIWKLALVLRGRAGPALLGTYDDERRAVARYNGDRSLENTRFVQQITAAASGAGEISPEAAVAGSRRYGNFLGMELGYSYSSAAVVPDGTALPIVGDEVTDYVPTAHPGRRAPHVWLEGPHSRCSTLDLFGPWFTLLAASHGHPWIEAAQDVATRRRVDIVSHRIGDGDWKPAGSQFDEQYGLGDSGAALVRPDGHVAFRSPGVADATVAARLLDGALRVVLGLR